MRHFAVLLALVGFTWGFMVALSGAYWRDRRVEWFGALLMLAAVGVLYLIGVPHA